MAYQIKRTEKIHDTLELCGEDGAVMETLDFVTDIDAVAGELQKHMVGITEAERALKKAADDKEYAAAYEHYGRAVNGVFAVCFGSENAEKIRGFYEDNYIEMSLALVPYIYEVILPRVNECLTRRREQLKNIYKGKRRFK